MKNFTKQITNKTLFEYTRWILMALMLLVGTSSAWGKTLYVYSSNSNSYAWIWNRSNSSNFTGGSWPGAKLNNTTYFTALGNNWYKFKTNITVEYGLILSGGASSGQTSDLFITDDIYCIKHNGGSSSETYGTPSGYKIKNSWGGDINFASFSEAKQAYTMNSIELAAGTYTMQVYKGSSKYWSSFDNSRGSGVTLSGGGEGGFSFTLASAMNVTFFYDPGAYKAFAVGVSACTPATSITSAELQQDGTISLVGDFTTCGAKFHGFQWRKSTADWCEENSANTNSGYVTIGNTDVNGSETASFTPDAGVTYEFRTYIATTSPWLYSTTTKEVSTCTPANVTISDLSSTTLCTGGSLTFTYTAAAGANVTFKMGTNPSDFIVTGGGSNSGTVTITYNSNSSTSINSAIKYDVSGTGICPLTDQSTGKTIKCGPVPSIAATSATSFNFCPGDDAVTLSVTAGQGTYKWAKDGEVIADKTTHSIEVSEPGTYTVFVVGTGGCQSNTVTFNVNGNGGPVIKSTDAEFNKNNFADFAALYVTDCSGKEITGYQWYKDGEAYVSTCNYTTKDGSEVGDAGQTNNIRPNAAGSYTCKATYKDGTSATSAPFTVTATSGTTYDNFNSPIPVIMVNTGSKNFPSCPVANETASKHADEMKKKLSVDVKILHNGSIVYDRKARMAYRGSSSLNFQKKSYAFCPGDANCGDDDKGPDYVQTAKLNMLGIGEATDKDWVLYAAAADPSMLRNRMVFETYQAMRNTGVTDESKKDWGVHSRYVELIINGEYKGVYLMMDKITQNKKRVNVKWEADGSSKGFIVKFDKTDIVDRSVDYPDGDEKTFLSKYSGKHNIGTYDTTNDQAFEIEYPEKEDIQEDGGDWYDVIDYIKGMFNSFEEALAAGDYTTVQQYIDYESWADWFILNEFTKNVDAYRASCVFTYDGTKIKANPLWDQELSFNNQSVHANIYPNDGGNKGCENVNYLLIQDDGVYSDNFAAPFWFTGKYVSGRGTYNGAATTFAGALLNDPCFVQTVKNRWEIHKQGALSKASLEALIAAYETELTSAVRDREANFWSSNSYSRNTLSCPWPGHTTGYYDDTYADAKADITAWISDAAASGSTGRRAGLDAAIDKLKGTGLTISFEPMTVETTPWMPVTITVNNESGYQYTLTYTDGELDKQANVIIEKSGDTYKYHVPRPAAWKKGNEDTVDERTDIVYGLKATLQMGDDKVVCGSSNNGEAPSATATIILQDEPNEDCPQ